jgi:hypothetical protein
VRAEGAIGSRVASGSDAIQGLVEAAVRSSALNEPARIVHQRRPASAASSVLKIGDPAPELILPDLNGDLTAVTSSGRNTLLLFWNPQCGFCERMLDDLRSWEADRAHDAPALLVISQGTVEENTAMNLKARVLLDQRFVAGPAFGAGGTPMAILLDSGGKIASDMAAGADAVFVLADTAFPTELGVRDREESIDGVVIDERLRSKRPSIRQNVPMRADFQE